MDIGAELKKARIARARYIPEIAHELKVPAPIIVAIEHSEFADVGNDERCAELVRAYAVAVGVDPVPLLAALVAAGGVVGVTNAHAEQMARAAAEEKAAAEAAAAAKVAAQRAEHQRLLDEKAAAKAAAAAKVAAKQERAATQTAGSGRRPWAVAAVLVAALAGGGVWATQTGNSTPEATPTPTPTVSTPSATPSASDSATAVPTVTPSETATVLPTETPSATPSVTASPTPKPSPTYIVSKVNGLIVMKVTCRKAASVHVYNASGTIFSGRLSAGATKTFTSDTDATFTTTNAGGLSMSVSGTDYGVLGEPGQVYTHKFRIG